MTDQFPEVVGASKQLPSGTVIDGELVAWDESESRPMEFSQLQRRLGRKKLGKRILEQVPVVLLAFDLLEHKTEDVRSKKLTKRQEGLEELIQKLVPIHPQRTKSLFDDDLIAEETRQPSIRLSPVVSTQALGTWQQFAEYREQAKQYRAEGLMLKRRESAYQVGRPVGDWWKWKVEPYTIDAVLIYAQRGHGRRASLYTDYTFAVWDEGELVSFAKAYSGLTDAEIRKVDAFVRKNTREKFGPVRSVVPELVFELAFENIQRSTRHRSGIAVRFPRISRWRTDKRPQDADQLSTILEMIDHE